MMDSTTVASAMLTEALKCAAYGWRVLPVKGKVPLVKNWPTLASTDEPTLTAWWTQYPDANVGLATGKQSNLFVLDVDPGKGGDESLRTLEAQHGALPATIQVLTGGGGLHYYFTHPAVAVGNSASALGPGLDIKTDGGQVVAPPSLHPTTGCLYAWEAAHHPADVALAAVPAWLLQHLTTPPGQRRPAFVVPASIPDGERNDQLFRLARSLRAKGLSREAIQAALQSENAMKCDHPLPADELEQLVAHTWTQPDRRDFAGGSPDPGTHTRPETPDDTSEPDARTRCTDVGNGELFARQHRETVRYCYGLKQWFVWDEQRWKPDDGGAITMLAKQTALSLYTRAAQETDEHRRKALAKWAAESETERRLKSMVSLAQSEPGIAITADRLDADPLRLNVLNGTLDLRTGDLRPARRDDFITKMAPVAYRPDAACPELDRMMTRLFGTVPAIRAYLQRIFGYALTGVTTEQCFFIFYGTGSNGKSTLLNTVLSILGEYAGASRPETFLVKHGDGGIPNEVAALVGVRFVVSLESEKGKRLAESLVKAMTGNDTMRARFLHKEFFSFTPQFKLFVGTNHKPTILGTDDGIWRRVRCVPFAVKILEEEKDTQLSTRLLAEGSGILAWLVQGCLAWQRDGLGEPLEILAASAAYRAEQDVLGVFLKERCVLERASQVFKKDLFETYLTWCEESGEHYRLTMREFGKVLRERGLTETRTASAKGWLGIRIRTPLDAEQDTDDELVTTPVQEGSDVNLDA